MNRPSWIGQTLGGRYKIEDLLGQGGMSAVYKAYDPNLKRAVAIKMIHTHLAGDPKFLTRFEEEATAVAQLRHPNIVKVFDFNQDQDLYYMVQEFLAGETLQERLRRLNKAGRRMPLNEAIQSTLQICSAAGYAHKRGLIHRDIKPANVMLDVHGEAILMDFGIVKITGGEKHTATGAVVGTALYMPPELIRGEAPDPRSDIYSLGVTLFEMVSGRPPFEADSAMSLMMMHLNDPVPDLRQLRSATPEELVAVIEKSLAKNQNERFTSADEMAAALTKVLGHIQPAAQPETTAVDQAALASAAATVVEPAMPGAGGPPPSPPAAVTGSGGGSGQSGTVPPLAAGLPPAKKSTRRLGWSIAVGVVLVIILVSIILPNLLGGRNKSASSLPALPSETTQAPAAIRATDTPEATATRTPTIAPSLPPTDTPKPSPSPMPTIPVGVPFARITGITIDNQELYVADYETFEFTESLTDLHIHFFYNTVPPEQAGEPGEGPWYVYGGPRPFNKFKQSERPKAATQLCILVASRDHSVQLNSGNCVTLPDVPVAAPNQDMACRLGPSLEYPQVAALPAGQVVLVQGISPDEGWWNVLDPVKPEEACWLQRELTTFSGDISTLPLVEPPALPTLAVAITGITIDDQERYVVEYVAQGFTEQLPGTHIHFFFNTVPADQVGAVGGGSRLMFGGPSPFSGYKASDRPPQAIQLCALVANPDHSVVSGSGNCFDLPDAP